MNLELSCYYKRQKIFIYKTTIGNAKADELLYFVIDEKNNTIDLTEKGIDLSLSESVKR